MGDAALAATVDIGRAWQMLRAMPYSTPEFLRGYRFVQLAHAQEMRLGYRSDNVETWLRFGFRILSRWAMLNGVA